MSNNDNLDADSKEPAAPRALVILVSVLGYILKFVLALTGNALIYIFNSGILGVKIKINYIELLPNSNLFTVSGAINSGRKQISNAVERSGVVYVYDEKGSQICGLPAGNGPDDGLKGYTSGSVSIRRTNIIYTYNAQGHQISTAPATSAHFDR